MAYDSKAKMVESEKSGPPSSQVHVPSAGEEDKPAVPAAPPAPLRATERSREVVPPEVNNDGVKLLDKDGGQDPRETTGLDSANGELNETGYIGNDGEAMMNLDLQSGQARADGYVGIDTYPHDDFTLVHDLNMGLPMVNDGEAQNVRWVNGIQYLDGDPKALLAEVHRVLATGGQFTYEGNEDLHPLLKDLPGLVLTDHEDNSDAVEKGAEPAYRQVFTRIETPDPATADDAEPRLDLSSALLKCFDEKFVEKADWDESKHTRNDHGQFGEGTPDPNNGGRGPDKRSSVGHAVLHDIKATDQNGKEYNFHGGKVSIHSVKNTPNGKMYIGTTDHKPGVPHIFHESQVASYHPKIKKSANRRVATVAVKVGNHLLMGKRRDNEKWTVPGGHANEGEDSLAAARRELMEETGIELTEEDVKPLGEMHKAADDLEIYPYQAELNERPTTSMIEDPDGEVYRWRWIDVSEGLPSEQAGSMHVPMERNVLIQRLGLKEKVNKCRVFKMDAQRRLVYGVVLIPDEVDSQGDYIGAEDIEKTAHMYLRKSRVIGSGHGKAIAAEPVESYISPVDFEGDGQYGPQVVKKGSWCLVVKVLDNQEWQKCIEGDYQGFSVGGFGVRE
jgi:8-oxo-dGTP pyrophosphatase MutT (NUDIX family)